MKNKKENINIKIRYQLVICIVMFLVLGIFLGSVFDFRTQFQKLHALNEEDNYYVSRTEVYVQIGDEGKFKIKGADKATFKVVDSYFLSKDKSHVYIGNEVIPGVNPDKLKPIGSEHSAYYVSGSKSFWVDNLDKTKVKGYHFWGYHLKLLGYNISLNKKPQKFNFTFHVLKKGNAYHTLSDQRLVTNGTDTYFNGLPMKKFISEGYQDLENNYVTDGKHVYYFNDRIKSLDYKDADIRVSTYNFGGRDDSDYLFNKTSGVVYVDGRYKLTSKAPYKVLTNKGEITNQILFINKDNCYSYYDYLNKKVVDTKVVNKITSDYLELSAGVFYNGKKLYFLDSDDIWYRSRHGGRLASLDTTIYEWKVPGVESLKAVPQKGGEHQVWQIKNDFYYFDECGSSQLIYDRIYKIKDFTTLKKMKNGLNPDSIRKLIKERKLIAISDKKKASSFSIKNP